MLFKREETPSTPWREPHQQQQSLPASSVEQPDSSSDMPPTPGSLAEKPEFTFWVLDTRELWPGQQIASATEDDQAYHVLQVLTPSERTRALKFYFPADTRLSIGSSLLKRLYITQALDVPWHNVRVLRRGDERHGKPAFFPATPLPSNPATPGSSTEEGTNRPEIDFNVSHQAGLVSLVGCRFASTSSSSQSQSSNQNTQIEVGTDIVCIDERNRDRGHIEREGFDGWVRMHADVFSDADIDAMIAPALPPIQALAQEISESESSGALLKVKMRRFYAYWALKEAYVKLTGEALLAPWLKEVEFRNVRVPTAADTTDSQGNSVREQRHAWGELVTGIQVLRSGVSQNDVELSLQAFEDRYMIATAIRGRCEYSGLNAEGADTALSFESRYMLATGIRRPPSRSALRKMHKEASDERGLEPQYKILDMSRDVIAYAEPIEED